MAKIGFENKMLTYIGSTLSTGNSVGSGYRENKNIRRYTDEFNENFGKKEPATGYNNFSYSELSTNITLYNSYSIPELSVCLTKFELKKDKDIAKISEEIKTKIEFLLKEKRFPDSQYLKDLLSSGYTIHHDNINEASDISKLQSLFKSDNKTHYIIFGLKNSTELENSICFVKPLASSIKDNKEYTSFIILPMLSVINTYTNYVYQYYGENNIYTVTMTLDQLIANTNLAIPIVTIASTMKDVYNY